MSTMHLSEGAAIETILYEADIDTAMQEVQAILDAAKSYPVPATPVQYEQVGQDLITIRKRSKWIEEAFREAKDPIVAEGRRIDALFRPAREFLEVATKTLGRVMAQYEEQQRQLREAAERQAAEAARREQERLRAEADRAEAKARAQREAAEQKARAQREAEEAKARALEEAGRAEAAAERRRAAEEAEQRRMQAAAEAEEARMRAAESTRLAAESMPTAPVIHWEAPKVAGISTRGSWSAELVDFDKLVLAVAAGILAVLPQVERAMVLHAIEHADAIAPRELLTVNMPTANKLARALKSGMNIPGLRAVETKTKAVRE